MSFSGKKAIWIVVADPVHLGEWGGGPEKPNISPQPQCFTRHGTVDDCDKLMLFEKVIY